MKLAAIDIGTNSIHMVVVEVGPGNTFQVVDRVKDMVKLGVGLFDTRRLSDRAYRVALETLGRYCKLAEQSGVEEILAVATSATREAENGGELLDAIFAETGLRPRVISGVEEGRLIFRAVKNAIDIRGQNVMVIDIGGGSVEVVVGNEERVLMSESLRLGVLRLLDRQGSTEPLSGKQVHALLGYIQGVAGDVIARARKIGFERVIGTSGTARTVSEAAHVNAGNEPWRSLNAQVARRRDIKELAKKLLDKPLEDRAKVPGIGEQRADAIHLGALLLDQLLELADKDEITVCEASLREGVILDYLDRHGPGHAAIAAPTGNVRRRSVLELARKFDRDDPRERHIASLGAQIFDRTAELHQFGAPEKELMEYAALLHGIGHYIDFKDRHKHSRYIIRNSGLRGFSDEEVELIAQTVRYHRESSPTRRHKSFRALGKREQRVVRVLAGILRLAVALDRGRSQVVKTVDSQRHAGQLCLWIEGVGDLELELWAARSKTEPLAKALRCNISVARRGDPLPELARSKQSEPH